MNQRYAVEVHSLQAGGLCVQFDSDYVPSEEKLIDWATQKLNEAGYKNGCYDAYLYERAVSRPVILQVNVDL